MAADWPHRAHAGFALFRRRTLLFFTRAPPPTPLFSLSSPSMADVTAVILAGGGNTNPLARSRCMPAVEIGECKGRNGARAGGIGQNWHRRLHDSARGATTLPFDTRARGEILPSRSSNPAWNEAEASRLAPWWGRTGG